MLWQSILQTNFTSWFELSNYLELDANQQKSILQKPGFSLNLPRRLAQKIPKKTLNDPILRQFLPIVDEERISESFVNDAVGDLSAQCTPRLLQKYAGRALLVASSACAMHCRFFFRRNYTYDSGDKQFLEEIELIAQDSTLEELILSGGDPLSLSNSRLRELFSRLKDVPHLKRMRFHTRFPIGIPERIDAEFLAILAELPWQIWFVVHCNHLSEMDAEVFKALHQIQRLGIPVLNQAVLLKGVNDREEVLKELFGTLADCGIFAYYLHQLDRVSGAEHFEVSEERGHELMRYLEKTLPGYAVPKYVREVAGEPSKTALHSLKCLNP
jgi:lysine 2,3-aminomutase